MATRRKCEGVSCPQIRCPGNHVQLTLTPLALSLMEWISKLTLVAPVALVKAVMVGVVGMTLVLTGCEKFALDRQMEELCKKDGGVKVYETVTLSASMFDQWGDPFPGWRAKVLQGTPEESLGPEYRYVVERVHLKNGDPLKGEGRLDRTSERIYRRTDGKLMGEAISYGRSGGDFIAYAHPTSKSCPIYQSANEKLIRSVFLRKGE